MAKTLFLVRVQPRSGLETFFRCGIKFSQEWQPVDVDDATAARLQAEQMLEVVKKVEEVFEPAPADAVTTPADAAAPVAAPAASNGASGTTDGSAPALADAADPVAEPAKSKKAGK